ncbi:MAG TPA: aminoglycoside phosphotransferase family protein [Candidatus Dormibacteraeota bacterium]|nr:aminoglycoside phosphotransferase family protein [Candidatus Dormibacteraeota bacterium]
MATTEVLLDEGTVLAHLRSRGVLGDDEAAVAQVLGGGVSNTVILVEAGPRRVVVKQALPRLRVAREWLADPSRTVTEGRALRVAATLQEDAVPAVVDLDEERNVLVVAAAPAGTGDWKQRLLHGDVSEDDVRVGESVGALLGRLHARTATDASLRADFDAWAAFEQLRVAPYFRSMVADTPELGDIVLPHVEAMARRRVCLVHGDVSPKNVLAGEGLPWLIDFEVACWGDPAFDVAFLLTHLAMKAVHRPAQAPALARVARAFLAAYRAEAGALLDEAHAAALLGCLLMARVDGRSPAEYLDGASRQVVRGLGLRVATAPPRTLDAAVQEAMQSR